MKRAPTPSFEVAEPSFWERVSDAESGQSYWIARALILRLLGVVYFVGFWTVVRDGLPLIGSDGLTPAIDYLDSVEQAVGGRGAGFLRLPSIFWLQISDAFLMRVAWLGAAAALVVALGYANAVLLAWLWFLYMSFVHIGQTWFAFGWEIQLLETGFLAIFLCPLLDGRVFPRRPPPVAILWLYRWLIFRIMLGAGLIKWRGDPCWRDLTCLAFHYETQPVPNPLSAYLHFLPLPVHKVGVLFNHLCELVAPFLVFGPRRARHVAGLLFITFQAVLIASGNLAFLNWLTIIPALACFDDAFFARFVPASFMEERKNIGAHRGAQIASAVLALVVALLSIGPIGNLMSSRQAMNTSFDRLHLVNSYGAFGSVSKVRYELVFEGSTDGDTWTPYEFKCKPTDVRRRPCVITPYHYRLDWLLWFAAMGRVEQYPWAGHLVWKLLQNDETALALLESNPFPESPPRFIRVERYRYELAPVEGDAWWRRERVSDWLPSSSLEDGELREFLATHGFKLS